MIYHPHIHMIVPGGGLLPHGGLDQLASCPPPAGARAWRHVPPSVPQGLAAVHKASKLIFHGVLAHLADPRAFARHLAQVRANGWVVYAKPPVAGPQAVFAYLSRYTHRVAISYRRNTAFDGRAVTAP